VDTSFNGFLRKWGLGRLMWNKLELFKHSSTTAWNRPPLHHHQAGKEMVEMQEPSCGTSWKR